MEYLQTLTRYKRFISLKYRPDAILEILVLVLEKGPEGGYILRMAVFKKATLSKFLQEARVKSGLSQVELARKLSYSSPQFVSNWERGLCSPPVDKLYEVSQILNVEPKDLMDIILIDTENFLRTQLQISGKRKTQKRA